MKREFTFAVLASIGLACGNASANNEYSRQCESCFEDSQFRAKARELEALTGKGGYFYVYNLEANLVQKWWIKPSQGGGSGGGGVRPMAATAAQADTLAITEAPVVNEVDKGHAVYISGGRSLRPLFNVPVASLNSSAINGKTAYNVVRDANLQAQIETILGDDGFLNGVVKAETMAAMVNLLQLGSNMLGLKQGTYLNFRLIMDDGSQIDFHLDISKTTAEVKLETARTPGGQLIPASPSNAYGEWSGEGDSLGVLADHLSKLGVPVEYTGTGSYINTISCAAGKCIVRRMQR